MITTVLKDRVLQFLIENQKDTKLTFDGEDVAKKLGTSPEYLNVILDDMAARKFLEKDNAGGYYTMLWLNTGLFDFYRLGGYEFEDYIIEGELLKLKNDIQKVQPFIDESRYDKMMTSINTIILFQNSLSGR